MAEALEALGITPLEPNRGEPLYDLAWETANAIFVAEVKSLTVVNEERQLRLGLGQVFRYRQLLEHHSKPVIAVLMAERQPADDSWTTLCQSLGVCLLWPAILPEALFVDLHSS